MKSTTSIALRANIALFAASTGIAIVPCISVALLFGLPGDAMRELSCRGSTFLIASVVKFLLRWYARRAFESAVEAHKVQLTEASGPEASIASDCPRPRLVQLHLELRGHRCAD
jgi:hypothetical protein